MRTLLGLVLLFALFLVVDQVMLNGRYGGRLWYEMKNVGAGINGFVHQQLRKIDF